MKRLSLMLIASMAVAGALTGCTATITTNSNAPAANTNAPKPAAAPTNTAAAPTNTAAAPAGGELSNLKITNKSKWAIHHLFLSPAKENEWGPDQLGNQTVEPGGTFTLKEIPCNTYDIKVVDEDGDECVITGEKFCGHEATWDLTDDELLNCEGYGDK